MDILSSLTLNTYIENMDSQQRIRLLLSYIMSPDSEDESLKDDITELFKRVQDSISNQNLDKEKLTSHLNISSKEAKLISTYLPDIILIASISGLGAGGKKKKNSPINSTKNVTNIKDIVAVISAVTLLITSVATPIVNNQQNERLVDLEKNRLKQHDRELDQRDRELDLQEKQLDNDTP